MTEDRPQSPAQLLAEAAAVARRTRAARPGFWFPLVLFGLLVIGAAPWYSLAQPDCPRTGTVTVCSFAGVEEPPNSLGVPLYWLFAVLLGYAATLAYYRLHASHVGVAGRVWPYLATGSALLAVTLLATPAVSLRLLQGRVVTTDDLAIRGMTPLLALAAGLFVLARLERSLPLAGFAVLFLVVALVANLYDVENQSPRIGWTPSAQWQLLPNLWLAGGTLLLGGLGFGLVRLLRGRARLQQGRPA
ncbi:hypothetical protein [Streptacidiphilus jiangxiensis]|uniref:DUF998 domain-containing protein n=1 Tax=Streptacidiphilus jiangxiensis TaxID=235985 RepID=A0A1H7HLA4_STRJI|nr:hypothetical protein [Streptacidiphilus jiangxiensis]SEK50437.1 hypothetical protein SAMN05414137_102242 [Streptacidiphilus jiangxiensis]